MIAADAAVRLKPAPDARVREIYREIGLDPDEPILAINVNRYLDTWADDGNRTSMGAAAFIDTYARAADRVARELQVPVLFVNTQHHDVELTDAIVRKMAKHTPTRVCSNNRYNHYEMKGVLGKVGLLFAMRLHANILGSSALTPIIGLNYQPKVKFYFDLLGLDEYSISFDDFSVDNLVAHMRKGWAERDRIRGILTRRIPRLQERAHSTARFVKAIDDGVQSGRRASATCSPTRFRWTDHGAMLPSLVPDTIAVVSDQALPDGPPAGKTEHVPHLGGGERPVLGVERHPPAMQRRLDPQRQADGFAHGRGPEERGDRDTNDPRLSTQGFRDQVPPCRATGIAGVVPDQKGLPQRGVMLSRHQHGVGQVLHMHEVIKALALPQEYEHRPGRHPEDLQQPPIAGP